MNEPLTFVGRHVRLEPLTEAHAPGLLAAADESRATFGLQTVPADLAGMRTFVETALAAASRGEEIPFVVRDAAGTIVGSTRFMAIERWEWPGPPPAPIPDGPDVVEIGYTWYAERVQRTGLNTEAKLLLCTHAFETWRVRRVTWKTAARTARPPRRALRRHPSRAPARGRRRRARQRLLLDARVRMARRAASARSQAARAIDVSATTRHFGGGGTFGTHVDCPAPVTLSGAVPSGFVVFFPGSYW